MRIVEVKLILKGRIDGERLHQIFLNLILNSVQAMEKQDRRRLDISTRVRTVRETKVGISDTTEPVQYVEARFSDNGPGISPEIIQNIFIPFFTTKPKGSRGGRI